MVKIASVKQFGGFPGGASGQEPANARDKRHGFDPWVRKIPWSRKWQPTPVFLPGNFRDQRSLVGYSPWGHKESDMSTNPYTDLSTNPYTDLFGVGV